MFYLFLKKKKEKRETLLCYAATKQTVTNCFLYVSLVLPSHVFVRRKCFFFPILVEVEVFCLPGSFQIHYSQGLESYCHCQYCWSRGQLFHLWLHSRWWPTTCLGWLTLDVWSKSPMFVMVWWQRTTIWNFSLILYCGFNCITDFVALWILRLAPKLVVLLGGCCM